MRRPTCTGKGGGCQEGGKEGGGEGRSVGDALVVRQKAVQRNCDMLQSFLLILNAVCVRAELTVQSTWCTRVLSSGLTVAQSTAEEAVSASLSLKELGDCRLNAACVCTPKQTQSVY